VDASRIEELFGEGVVVEVGVPGEVEGRLFPGEEALLGRAVEKRRREFVAGRVLARRALARLGAPEEPIVTQGDRAPIWPRGFTGSITHTRTFCAVVAARVSPAGIQSLGIDAEDRIALSDELLPKICNERERAWLSGRAEPERGILGKLFFSAKEAFYKCQSPLTGRFLGFEDVDLELDVDGGRFDVIVHAEENALPADVGVHGRFAITDDLILSTARADRRAPERTRP
jgi:4'-phosphopantetheinyl transferase EntD